jgi:hypothetical protein
MHGGNQQLDHMTLMLMLMGPVLSLRALIREFFHGLKFDTP